MAPYYTARNEVIEIPPEFNKTNKLLAEHNPNDTYGEHTIEVMEYLSGFIQKRSECSEYFVEEDDEEEEDG